MGTKNTSLRNVSRNYDVFKCNFVTWAEFIGGTNYQHISWNLDELPTLRGLFWDQGCISTQLKTIEFGREVT